MYWWRGCEYRRAQGPCVRREEMIEWERSNRAALNVFYGKSNYRGLYGIKYDDVVHLDINHPTSRSIFFSI